MPDDGSSNSESDSASAGSANRNDDQDAPFTPLQLGAYLHLPCPDIARARSDLAGYANHHGTCLVLSAPHFAALWPYVSNVWQVARSRARSGDDDVLARDWRCRYYRKPDASASTGKRKRAAAPTAAAPRCKTRCLVTTDHATGCVRLVFVGAPHNHPLDTCDADKLHDALRDAFQAYILGAFAGERLPALEAWRADARSQRHAHMAGLRRKVDAQLFNNLARDSSSSRMIRDAVAMAAMTTTMAENGKGEGVVQTEKPDLMDGWI